MKRFLFSVCALAAVVVGCSKSEVLNRPNADMPIEFNPYTGRIPVTKAAEANKETLGAEGFQVYAFLHGLEQTDHKFEGQAFMDKEVTMKNDKWVYPGRTYWPANGVLDFIAYGLNSENQITKGKTKNMITYTVNPLVASQEDLLVALCQRNLTYDEEKEGKVDLRFYHLLSKIGFTLITTGDDATNVRIDQVNLEGSFYENGEVNLAIWDSNTGRPYISIPTGTSPKENTTYQLLLPNDDPNKSETFTGCGNGVPIYNNNLQYTVKNPDKPVDRDYIKREDSTLSADEQKQLEDNLNNRYMMIIPITAAQHNAKLKVRYYLPCDEYVHENVIDLSNVKYKDENGVEQTASFDFEAGKSYNFQFKVSTNSIGFNVDVEIWDTSDAADVNKTTLTLK